MDSLIEQLSKANLAGGGDGVSFAGKSLKVNNSDDAKDIIQAIKACKNLEFLNLEGNTIGVDAAKGIGTALSRHNELKRALWKDMFTGRSKDEIPQALRYMSSGLEIAGAKLVELDLSDNAVGPIGMEGLSSLLRSPVCHMLQRLVLNNNGLGQQGAKMLSKAMMDCYHSTIATGNPFSLRVFIAGRNRLEDNGIKALSKVFQELGSLEELQVPQNGIRKEGIQELTNALKKNPGLKVLNLNDNTLGLEGTQALNSALPQLQLLKHLDLGDCLLRNEGAIKLASGLQLTHVNLEELIVNDNEIKKDGGIAIANAMKNKKALKLLSMDGNEFGKDGVQQIVNIMKNQNKGHALGSFEEIMSESDDSNDSDNDDEDNVELSSNKTGNSESVNGNGNTSIASIESADTEHNASIESKMLNQLKNMSASGFLKYPSPERFLALGEDSFEKFLKRIESEDGDEYLETMLSTIMKVSSLYQTPSVSQPALECSCKLYKELYSWAKKKDCLKLVNNSLIVHLGFLKSEKKYWKPDYNFGSCRAAALEAGKRGCLPKESVDSIVFFLKDNKLCSDC